MLGDLHRRGPRRRQGRRPALRLADHRRQRPADEGAAASLPRAGQGAPRRRPGRGGDRRDARRRRATPPSWSRSTTRCCPRSSDAAKAHAKARRRSTTSRRTTPATSGRSATRRACDAAFAKAAHVTKLEFVNNRLIPNAIEPRAAIGAYSPRRRRLHAVRREPEPARRAAADDRVRARPARAQGARGRARRRRRLRLEDLPLRRGRGGHLGGEAAQPAGEVDRRPLAKSFLSDAHGRDHVTIAELALDKDGKFLAMRVKTTANLGAYLSTFASCIPTILYATLLAGQYTTPLIYCEVTAVFTNTTPVDAYRGAGRPGGDLRRRAPGGDRGARDEDRPGRDPPAQLHPQLPVPDAGRAAVRHRRLRRDAGRGA